MEHKKKKELRIRSCLTGAIWLALAFSMLISALLFAFLNHFFELPGKIPGLGWLLIFNTLIAGLITLFINARLLEPITRLSKAMKAVSQGDFEQHLETNSRIAEIGESYQSFNVMTKSFVQQRCCKWILYPMFPMSLRLQSMQLKAIRCCSREMSCHRSRRGM